MTLTTELEGRNFIFPVFQATTATAGDVALAYPPDLPASGTPIHSLSLANNGPFAAGTGGIWCVLFDRGGRYVANSGWPNTQNGSFYPLIPLIEMQIGPNVGGASINFTPPPVYFDPPLIWRPGDLIVCDFGCVGGQYLQPMLSIRFDVPYGQTIPGPFNVNWNGQPV